MIIGKIYSTGCIHCINMGPAWNNLKIKINKIHSGKVHFIEIEASENQDHQINEINQRYVTGNNKLTANGYPTIFKIVKGNVVYYESERSTHKMYNWVFPLQFKKSTKRRKHGLKKQKRRFRYYTKKTKK
jgi:hypothetical protein